MNRILVLDSGSRISRHIAALLADAEGYESLPVQALDDLAESAARADAIVCPYARESEALTGSSLPVVVVDDEPGIRRAVAAIKGGASDYLASTCTGEELLESLIRVIAERDDAVETTFPTVGASPAMQTLADSIIKVGPTDSTVLITGESGTGKELVARAVHAGSGRRSAKLISLNCATVPGDLIEAELFGTSGDGEAGLLAGAAGGTLFLDEVGELPSGAQARLLRSLESGIDVRLIVATTRDLETQVSNGHFRSDLYYRLKVIALKIPPLRERGDDVLMLAEDILTRTMEKLGKRDLSFTEETQADMRRYQWPGNVRELENAIQRAVILSDGGAITTSMLAIELPREEDAGSAGAPAPDQTIEDYFVNFVTTHQDSMTETELAEKLGISRKSLWERRQRLNIPRKKTKKRGRRRDVS
jgi:two-component system response regulator HydG